MDVTEYAPDKTLKIGFPPAGSPLLDLEVCPADLLVGMLQTMARFSNIFRVSLHPDVEKAYRAVERRLEGAGPPLDLPFEEERQAGWLVDMAHILANEGEEPR